MLKSNCPLRLISGCATLFSNSHSLQNCFNADALDGFQAWKDCLRSCHNISIGFKSRLLFGCFKTLICSFLIHSEVDLLVCLGSLSCCISALELEVTNWQPDPFRIFITKNSSPNTDDLYIHYMDKSTGTPPSLEEKKALPNCGNKDGNIIHTDWIIISLWFLSYTQRHCHVRIEKSSVQTVAIKLEAHNS